MGLTQIELEELLDLHRLYVLSLGKEGEQIRLNKMDFSKMVFKTDILTDVFITESYFERTEIKDCEVFEAKLCGCEFNEVTFKNVKFVDTDFSFCKFNNCIFNNSKLINCETYHTIFDKIVFDHCILVDCFSYALLNDVMFSDIDFNDVVFYYSIIKNLKFKKIENLQEDVSAAFLNLGTFEEEIRGDKEMSLRYFRNNRVIVE